MKKRFLILSLLFLGITGIFIACQDDIDEKPPQEKQWSIWDWFSNSDAVEISKAQNWYKENGEPTVRTKSGVHPLFDEMIPYWQQSYVRQDDYCRTVEVALCARKRKKFVEDVCSMMYEDSKEQKYLQSLTRLVIKTDLKTKKVEGFFMTIVPSLEYLEDCNFQPFVKNTYTERDENFDGYIYYHELNGEFANGWKYTNGEITHTVKPLKGVLTKSYGNTYCQTIYELNCTDWYQTGEYTDESGSHTLDPQYVGTTCTPGATGRICWTTNPTQDGGGSSSGGGGGGGSSSGGGGTSGGYNPPPVNPEKICPLCSKKNCTEIHEICDDVSKVHNRITVNNYNMMANLDEFNYTSGSRVIRHYPSYQAFLSKVAQDPNREHSTTVLYYEDEKCYRLDSIRTGTEKNVATYGSTPNAVAVIHSHPDSNPSLPSMLDVITTADNARQNPNFKFLYTYVKGDIYAFYVEDRVKAAAFYEKYHSDIDMNTNMFKESTDAAGKYLDARELFGKYSTTDKNLYGLTYFLNTNNSGIRVLKKSKAVVHFESVEITKRTKNGINYTVPTKCSKI